MGFVDPFVASERTNAALGWASLGVVFLVAVGNALGGSPLWAAFAGVVVLVAAAPAVVTRRPTAFVPWPLAAIAAVALIAQTADAYPEVAGYVAVAVLAVIGTVELEAFTDVEMTRRFAVVFAVLTTMAVESLWTVAQFYSDRVLNTSFLGTQTELQWDLVAVTAVGVALGGFIEWYLYRVERARSRNEGGRGVDAR